MLMATKPEFWVAKEECWLHFKLLVHWKFICDHIGRNSSLWKRVIVWGRSRTARAHGIIWGDAGQNKEEFSAECCGVDCNDDSKVLTELQIAIRSKLLF